MKKILLYSSFIVVFILLIIACTPNANTYYNRQMQPIVTKYNVLFNGEEAYAKGVNELRDKYQDNFAEILPVEPIGMSGKVQLDGIGNPNFERAEEKAIKTIQRHSMVFKGIQRNYKIDDAYMLLGQARYYNERFFPALEAFNHLLTNYGVSERIPEATIWAQKTNLRLGKDKVVIEKLIAFLKENPKIHRNDKAEAYATLGQAYINQELYPEAAEALYYAGKYTRNKALRGRYYFIAAQLYEKQHQKDSAEVAFEKVIKQNWKIPRKLWVEAQFGKARNNSFTTEEKTAFLTYLYKLEKRYEHKDYLDVLYYTHGELLKDEQKEIATNYYRQSLLNNKNNNSLKAKAHTRLSELFFEQKDYIGAYQHLDSTLTYIPEHTFEHLFVRRKRDNLAKIAELEFIVKKNDSILRIVHMPENERRSYYQKYIDSMQQIIALRSQKEETKKAKNTGIGFITFDATPLQGGKFYFYNPITLAYGKQQFEQYWGDRKLEDNWRWSTVNYKDVANLISSTTTETILQKEVDTPENYISKLPKTETELSKLSVDRNEALFQLGVLYRAKFNEKELAIQRLERVLANNPTSDLEVVTLYELQKNYTDSHNPKAEDIKARLLTNYANTDYAKLLQGNITSQQERNKIAQIFVDTLTAQYIRGEIKEVAFRLQEEGREYRETALAPTIALLQAKTTARLMGIHPYREQLQQIVTNYPATVESEEAKNLLEELKNLENESYISDDKASKWKVVITGTTSDTRTKLREFLTEKLKSISEVLMLSEDLYNSDETWWVIHNIRDGYSAQNIIKELKSFLEKQQLSAFAIASENYRLIQIRKEKEKLGQ
nr:tetratricopeptide repeat protein [uncultured Capnocytophaga sp.]